MHDLGSPKIVSLSTACSVNAIGRVWLGIQPASMKWKMRIDAQVDGGGFQP